MGSLEDLETWRSEIRQIDAELLHLVARRMQLATQVGTYKKTHHLPVKDFRVEKQIIEKARATAVELGIYPALAEELMTSLINFSVLKQDELKREGIAPLAATPRGALIIGGAGHMGQWFAQYYESLGFAVSIYDPSAAQQSYPVHAQLDRGLEAFEVILLATPMPVTQQLLLELSRLPTKALIIEISSLKSPVLSGLQQLVRAGKRIASLHPMFGPDTAILAGKNILFCTGPGLVTEEVLPHFQQTSAQLLQLPLAQHDPLMSYVLGAAHLINLIYAQVLGGSGESMKELKQYAGTTFFKQQEVTARVVAENQDLYFDIQCLNLTTPELIAKLRETLETFAQVFAGRDRETFKSMMTEAQAYFADV